MAILTSLLLLLSSPISALQNCSDDRVAISSSGAGDVFFSVTLADTPVARERGLMNVTELGEMEGMLFVYDRPQHARFWMHNTPLSLDMIFADEEGEIRHIHENAVPFDETIIDGGRDISYVLEIRGGMARRLGLEVGDLMRTPQIDQKIAAWPCE